MCFYDDGVGALGVVGRSWDLMSSTPWRHLVSKCDGC